ncbi:hypothetical protein, partial [Liquorilactobacillus nagelii]|uniref:hypothetical protein n=1 Tax=Liquorilactobacillus nagelii TaxID=82688 RepID=UPI001F3F2D81
RNFVQFSKVYCFNNATFKVYNIIHNQSRTNLKFLFLKARLLSSNVFNITFVPQISQAEFAFFLLANKWNSPNKQTFFLCLHIFISFVSVNYILNRLDNLKLPQKANKKGISQI